MKLPIFQVDAFAAAVFAGNPAAVVLLERWLDDATLQAIAQENNLSETAFLLPLPQGEAAQYGLRWFTPVTEVDLCGHATLASGQVVLGHLSPSWREVSFSTRSGRLKVTREEGSLTVSLPARKSRPAPIDDALCAALGARPQAVLLGVDLLAVFASADEVSGLRPDFGALCNLAPSGFIVCAPGVDCDFVSRFFAPREGVSEDPVTGAAHCALVPYWAERLGKTALRARQISARGGELRCRLAGAEVLLSGRAITYLEGTIFL